MDSLKKVSQQTVWQLIGKAITSISTLIILGSVTRHYGEAGTGLFNLALTYLAFFYLAVDFGWNAYVMPDLLNLNRETAWRELLGLRIIWSGVLILISILLLPLLPFSNAGFVQAIIFGCLAIFGNALFVSANALFQSKLKYNYSIIASSVDAIPTVVLILLFISFNLPIQYLLLVHMIGWLLTGLVAIFYVKKFIKQINPIFNFNQFKKIFKNAWPISLTLVLNVVYFRADSFILTSVKGFVEVGVYSVAYQIFQSALVLPTFIMNGYYPLMLEKLNGAKELFVKELKRVLFIMVSLSVLGIVATLILAPFVIHLLSPQKGFEGSIASLRILSLSFPAYFLSSVLMWTLVSLKRYKVMLAIYVLGLLVNGMLNFIFIPRYSYIASSWITGISEYLILFLQIFILFPKLKKGGF